MKRMVLLCAVSCLLASNAAAAETNSGTTEASKRTQAATESTAAVSTTGQANIEAKPVKVALHEHPTLLRMLRRNNELRQRVGLRPHRMNPELTKAAQDHAVYMARTRSFSHYSNGGPQGRAHRWGFRGFVRENIAMGQHDVQGAFASWQNSGGHWASIVSGTTDAGFGYAVDSAGRGYWVAVYGTAP